MIAENRGQPRPSVFAWGRSVCASLAARGSLAGMVPACACALRDSPNGTTAAEFRPPPG